MAKFTYENMDAVPEDLKPHAETVDGKFVVDVGPAAKIREFRENNVKLLQERDELKGKLGTFTEIPGDDLEAFKGELGSLRELKGKVDNKDLIQATSMEEALAKRTAEMKTGFENQLLEKGKEAKSWQDKYIETDNELKSLAVRQHITAAVLDPKSGIRADALEDILNRAYPVFKAIRKDRGKYDVTPYDGEAVIYGEDASTPMSALDWVKKLAEKHTYYLKSSGGAGAGGDNGAGGGGVGGKMTPEQAGNLPPDQFMAARKAGRI